MWYKVNIVLERCVLLFIVLYVYNCFFYRIEWSCEMSVFWFELVVRLFVGSWLRLEGNEL